MYVFGGFTNAGSVYTTIPLQPSCDVYDPATNAWTRLRDFPEPFTHSEAVVWGTDIWFPGGYIGNHPGPGTTHVWVYHTNNDTWTRGPDLPQARGAGAATLVGHTLYFAGGMNAARTVDQSTVWSLDLTDTAAGWVRLADMPNARNHLVATTVGAYLYVIGGQHGQEGAEVPQSEVDRFDPSTNSWSIVAALPVPLAHITASVFAYDGRIVVIGGESTYGAFQSTVYDYDPAANRWSVLGHLPMPRGAIVSGIVDGQIVVTTGNAPTSPAAVDTWIGAFQWAGS